MKYDKKTYNTITLYDISEDEKCHKQKLVKTRKEHKCSNCKRIIAIGNNAIRETCIFEEKRASCYTCIECADKYFDDIGIKKAD